MRHTIPTAPATTEQAAAPALVRLASTQVGISRTTGTGIVVTGIHGAASRSLCRTIASEARNSLASSCGIKISPKRFSSKSRRPMAQSAASGVLFTTIGPSGIREILFEVLGILAEGRKAVFTHQEDEAKAWNSGEPSGQAGGQLAPLIELEGEEQTSLDSEFLRRLLESPKNFGWVLDARCRYFTHGLIRRIKVVKQA